LASASCIHSMVRERTLHGGTLATGTERSGRLSLPPAAFMNHSCDPNTGYIYLSQDDERILYRIPCLKDIQPGDVLTADYAILWYDLGSAAFEKCLCGARNCRGSFKGFKVRVMIDDDDDDDDVGAGL
jgi:hypothetical protein